jgi:hypothetical protein
VDADGAPRPARRGAVEVRAQPRGAADARPGRLEVPVEVVHPEQLQVGLAGGGRGGRDRVALLGARPEAEQRHGDGRGEGGDAGRQVTAFDRAQAPKHVLEHGTS